MSLISEATIKSYKETVQRARKQKSSMAIANRYPWHGQIAMRELLKLATSSCAARAADDPCTVRLLTGSFPVAVYGRLLSDFEEFVSAGGRLKVFAWHEQLHLGSFASLDQVESRHSGTSESGDKLNHFMLIDDFAYRYEAPHGPFQSSEFNELSPPVPARICFNDPTGGAQLLNFFNDLWNATDSE